jgi:small subunit ribosomal protein S16
MSVKIRLTRTGTKNAPSYRIVAIDSRKKRDGESLEILGSYNPITGQVMNFNQESVDSWIQKGAEMSDAVKKIQKLHRKSTAA